MGWVLGAVEYWASQVKQEDGDVLVSISILHWTKREDKKQADMHLAKLTVLSILNEDANKELFSYLYTIQKPV